MACIDTTIGKIETAYMLGYCDGIEPAASNLPTLLDGESILRGEVSGDIADSLLRAALSIAEDTLTPA